jgi:hypothetical protein
MEEFREIKEYPNYEVSNCGRVRNKRTQKTLCHSVYIDKYSKVRSCKIGLYKNDKVITNAIHRLVAQAFIPNPDNKLIVDHIDRDPTNNNVSNLRWATPKENGNNKNRPTQNISNTSGELNIYYSNREKRWLYRVSVDCKIIEIGRYSSFEEAKKAKDSGIINVKKHSSYKLTDIDIMEIRVLYGFGVLQTHIAKQFGVSKTCINLVVNGKTGKHVKLLL